MGRGKKEQKKGEGDTEEEEKRCKKRSSDFSQKRTHLVVPHRSLSPFDERDTSSTSRCNHYTFSNDEGLSSLT